MSPWNAWREPHLSYFSLSSVGHQVEWKNRRVMEGQRHAADQLLGQPHDGQAWHTGDAAGMPGKHCLLFLRGLQ